MKIQDHAFRDLPQKVKDNVLEYLGAREYLMVKKAEQNPGFAQKLDALEQFPLTFPMAAEADPLDAIEPPPAPMPEEPLPLPEELPPEMIPGDALAGGQPLPPPQALGQPELEPQNPDLPPIMPGVGQIPIS